MFPLLRELRNRLHVHRHPNPKIGTPIHGNDDDQADAIDRRDGPGSLALRAVGLRLYRVTLCRNTRSTPALQNISRPVPKYTRTGTVGYSGDRTRTRHAESASLHHHWSTCVLEAGGRGLVVVIGRTEPVVARSRRQSECRRRNKACAPPVGTVTAGQQFRTTERGDVTPPNAATAGILRAPGYGMSGFDACRRGFLPWEGIGLRSWRALAFDPCGLT